MENLERKARLEALRKQWAEVKKQLNEQKITELKAVIQNHGLNISPMSYWFTKIQMQSLGYDGIPYLDTKTFNGWNQNGFKVKKGEKSKISGIVWLEIENSKNPDDEGYLLPKEYHLFHRSQVQAAG